MHFLAASVLNSQFIVCTHVCFRPFTECFSISNLCNLLFKMTVGRGWWFWTPNQRAKNANLSVQCTWSTTETHDIQYSLLFQLIAIRTRVKRMDESDKEKKDHFVTRPTVSVFAGAYYMALTLYTLTAQMNGYLPTKQFYDNQQNASGFFVYAFNISTSGMAVTTPTHNTNEEKEKNWSFENCILFSNYRNENSCSVSV